jgi:flagellar biosynthesis chaperone FliJ
MDELNIDFSGWVEPGSNGLQMLSYEVFVVPLINAVKKQKSEIEELKQKVDMLMGLLEE